MPTAATLAPTAEWPFWQKLAFRFFFAYFVLYVFPFPLDVVPGIEPVTKYYPELWHNVVPWVGRHVLGIYSPITTFTNGSGDTTYDYVLLFCVVSLALLACLVWTALDRHRRNYNRLLYVFFVLLRYYLAFTMFSYGFAKVFKTQFPYPSLTRLMQPYGQSSPMGLAWTFLGYSLGYNYFMALAELGGGVLLLFRRTQLLGALVLVGAIGNVVAMNFCFDIPVKLFSSNLLLMALLIAAPDARRLLDLFVRNRPAPAREYRPFFTDRRRRVAGTVVKVLTIGTVLVLNITSGLENARTYGDAAPKPPLYGLYDVQTFVRNADTLAPLTTDTTRWRKFVVGNSRFANVVMMNDSSRWFALKLDTVRRTLTLTGRDDTLRRYAFNYLRPDARSLLLRGGFRGDSLTLHLRRLPDEHFLLTRRGFHWVNEFPFNR